MSLRWSPLVFAAGAAAAAGTYLFTLFNLCLRSRDQHNSTPRNAVKTFSEACDDYSLERFTTESKPQIKSSSAPADGVDRTVPFLHIDSADKRTKHFPRKHKVLRQTFTPQFRASSECESSSAVVDGVHSVAAQVPFLHIFSATKRIKNFDLKVKALRQAFSMILNDTECHYFICEMSRRILSKLTKLNKKDVLLFHILYDRVLSMVQNPTYHEGIKEELEKIGVKHFNFMDVFFELAMLRILAQTSCVFEPRSLGFISSLKGLISSVSLPSSQNQPGVDYNLYFLQNTMLLLLKKILTMEETLYEAPEALASAVWIIIVEVIDDLSDKYDI